MDIIETMQASIDTIGATHRVPSFGWPRPQAWAAAVYVVSGFGPGDVHPDGARVDVVHLDDPARAAEWAALRAAQLTMECGGRRLYTPKVSGPGF